jgi:hypothetical protein
MLAHGDHLIQLIWVSGDSCAGREPPPATQACAPSACRWRDGYFTAAGSSMATLLDEDLGFLRS